MNLQTNKPVKVYSAKTNFVNDLKKFINHKNILANTSTWYKQVSVARSLAIVNSVFLPLLKNNELQPLQTLCKLVIAHKENLMAILPSPNNDSYISSNTSINSLINQAKSYTGV